MAWVYLWLTKMSWRADHSAWLFKAVITVLFLFGPRLATVIWYIANPVYFAAAFQGFLLPCLGFLFLPWTLLAYLAVYPGGVTGFDWVIIGLGVLADIVTWGGGGYGNRNRIPGYQKPA